MPSNMLDLIATTAFGVEAVVARELKQLGFENLQVSDGRVVFSATQQAICRANLWLRSLRLVISERCSTRLGRFRGPSGYRKPLHFP